MSILGIALMEFNSRRFQTAVQSREGARQINRAVLKVSRKHCQHVIDCFREGAYWPVYNVINCLYFSSSFILMNAENLLVVITQHHRALSRKCARTCDSQQPMEQGERETIFLDIYKLPPAWLMDSRLSAFYNKVLFGGKNRIGDPKLIAFSMSKLLSEVCSLSLLLVLGEWWL